jgi:hypothetical protein
MDMKTLSSVGRTLLGLTAIAATLAMTACGAVSGASTGTPTATAATARETPTASGLLGYPIKVYFSNDPANMTSVAAVNRVSPTAQVEEFAMQMLIAGPTPEERASGLFSELNDAFNGDSNCAGALPVGGPDFTLSLNMKGSTPSPGTVTLKFCRATTLAGEGTGFRIGAEIDTTLMQFPNVKKSIILDMNGNCWGGTDLRGGNACLH